MQYLISFFEGLITFISPCMLPMLPVYLSYFSGKATDNDGNNHKHKALLNSVAFVVGFSIIFILLGAFSGSLGQFIFKNNIWFNIIGGLILIIFGLNYVGLFKISFLNNTAKFNQSNSNKGFLSSVLFGIIFAIGWSPCVGPFLGSALVLAANEATIFQGVILLVIYSLGLGIPFVLSAVLIEQLKGAFNFIKRNYKIINVISGSLLIIMGILMMTGLLSKFLNYFSFSA